MIDKFEKPLKDSLAECADREFLFVKPGGNYGDDLIYKGLEKLARVLNLRGQTVTAQEFVAAPAPGDKVIYIHGCGGLNPWGRGTVMRIFEHAIQREGGTVILGPQTIETGQGYAGSEFFSKLANYRAASVTMYVREKTSLNLLIGNIPKEYKLHLDHDTAFHLTPADLLDGEPVSQRYDLLGLREDPEQPEQAISVNPSAGVRLDPAYFAMSFKHWIRLHAQARRIITNRTHSSIAGAILGKPTTLLPGVYHKNRSIWEYSMQDKNVKWMESADLNRAFPTTHSGAVWWEGLPLAQKIAGSWKVQRSIKYLRGVPLN